MPKKKPEIPEVPEIPGVPGVPEVPEESKESKYRLGNFEFIPDTNLDDGDLYDGLGLDGEFENFMVRAETYGFLLAAASNTLVNFSQALEDNSHYLGKNDENYRLICQAKEIVARIETEMKDSERRLKQEEDDETDSDDRDDV